MCESGMNGFELKVFHFHDKFSSQYAISRTRLDICIPITLSMKVLSCEIRDTETNFFDIIFIF